MIGKVLGLANSAAGWWFIYMHATHQFKYFEDERWIPYLIIGGFSIMLAALGGSFLKDRD